MVAATTDLALGPAEVVLVALDDLVLDAAPHNVPGTVHRAAELAAPRQSWSDVARPERAPPAAAAAITALIAARRRP